MRQYIGARYVPKFADPILHDSTRSYEAFEIVQNAVGDSFTSKKPVPVGVALTDTTYWVSSGNFNAQLALVKNDIDEINAVYTLKGKKVAVFGDSWADGFADGWVDDIENYTGVAVHNNSVSGSDSAAILTRINADTYVADVYIIECGINDWNNNTNPGTFASNITSIVSRCRTLNPDCDIMFTTPPYGLSQLPNYPAVHTYFPLEMYRQVVWTSSEKLHFMVCSGLKLNNFVNGDGLHPLSTPHCLANEIIKTYANGGDSRDFSNEVAKVSAGDLVYIIMQNGKAYIRINMQQVFTSGVAQYTNSYLTTSQFFNLLPASRTIDLAGDGFIITGAFNSTGIQFKAIRVSDGTMSSVNGGITFDFTMPASIIGVDDDMNSYLNNP